MSENNSIKAHGGVLVNRITKVDSTGLFSITISEDLANDVENIADVESRIFSVEQDMSRIVR